MSMTILDKYTIDIIKIITPLVYIALGIAIYEIAKTMLMRKSAASLLKKHHHKKRVETVNVLILNIIKYIIIIFVSVLILANFGVNVGSILAGLGIASAVVGLAFQDMAKDLIAGISIIMEDQYEIGDTIEVNGFKGEVVALGLRTTRIKDYKGATKIIANHLMTEIVNYNLYPSLAIIDVSAGYQYDSDKVEKVLNDLAKNLKGKIPKSKGDIKILGIEDLEASGVIYRVTVEVASNEQYTAQRILRKEIKKALDAANIEIPYQQIEVHNGGK